MKWPDVSIEQALCYEVASSPWACYVSSKRLQDLIGSYFAWKTNRKWRRYKAHKMRRDIIEKEKS